MINPNQEDLDDRSIALLSGNPNQDGFGKINRKQFMSPNLVIEFLFFLYMPHSIFLVWPSVVIRFPDDLQLEPERVGVSSLNFLWWSFCCLGKMRHDHWKLSALISTIISSSCGARYCHYNFFNLVFWKYDTQQVVPFPEPCSRLDCINLLCIDEIYSGRSFWCWCWWGNLRPC